MIHLFLNSQPEQAERQLRRPLSVAPPLLPDVEKIAPAVGIGPCREAQKADRLPALVFDQAGIVILRGQIGPAERNHTGFTNSLCSSVRRQPSPA